MDQPRTDPDWPFFLYFFAAGQIKNKPADRSNTPVNKEIGPDRSKFHVPQIACDDTLEKFLATFLIRGHSHIDFSHARCQNDVYL